MVNNTALREIYEKNNGNSTSSHSNQTSSCAIQLEHKKGQDGTFIWPKNIQGFILASYFYGYIITQVGFLMNINFVYRFTFLKLNSTDSRRLSFSKIWWQKCFRHIHATCLFINYSRSIRSAYPLWSSFGLPILDWPCTCKLGILI